jgi:Uma2 family endonuclease
MERTSVKGLMSIERFYALPDDGLRYELQTGTLVSEPLPGMRHGIVAATIVELLRSYVRSRRLGVVMAGDAGYVLARCPDTLRGPDVSFLARERLDTAADLPRAFPGAPDLAVEVLFPSNRPADIHAKVADYLAAGTRLVWVVDPESQSVAVYRSLLAPRLIAGADMLEGEDVVPGFRVAVAELFEI